MAELTITIDAKDVVDKIRHLIPILALRVDDPVWVRESMEDEWEPRHFAGLDDDFRILVWGDGLTSHTKSLGSIREVRWLAQYIRLASGEVYEQ